ncbi:hypothetical protein DITRI_Ditri05aG0136400 [Diplodiscus trichospermus]
MNANKHTSGRCLYRFGLKFSQYSNEKAIANFEYAKQLELLGFKIMIASGYALVQEKLPNYVVPDLTDFKVQVAACLGELFSLPFPNF